MKALKAVGLILVSPFLFLAFATIAVYVIIGGWLSSEPPSDGQ